jgi:hypothetical protein
VEYRLKVFDNRVMSRIFGPKRDEVTRGRRNYINITFTNFTLRETKMRMMNSRRTIFSENVA